MQASISLSCKFPPDRKKVNLANPSLVVAFPLQPYIVTQAPVIQLLCSTYQCFRLKTPEDVANCTVDRLTDILLAGEHHFVQQMQASLTPLGPGDQMMAGD